MREQLRAGRQHGGRVWPGRRLRVGGLLLCGALVGCSLAGCSLAAQRAGEPKAAVLTLQDYVTHLPEEAGREDDATRVLAVSDMLLAASAEDAAAAMPALMVWVNDSRPRVRTQALFVVFGLYVHDPQRKVSVGTVPPEYLGPLVEHVHDADPSVRPAAFEVAQVLVGDVAVRERTVDLLLPMLEEAGALTPLPDHRADDAHAAMLAKLPPAAQASFAAQYRQPLFEPYGPEILGLLWPSPRQQPEVDAGILKFLARPDQTASALREAIRTVSLHPEGERVNEAVEALALQPPALSPETLEYVPRFEVDAAYFLTQKQRLEAIVIDPAQTDEVRRAGKAILLCWDNDRHHVCNAHGDVYGSAHGPDRQADGQVTGAVKR